MVPKLWSHLIKTLLHWIEMPKTVILYHGSCQDGLGSKYAAWKKFQEKAEYYPCYYGQPLPEFNGKADTTIYFLDFSVSRDELTALRSLYKRVVVIDHHVTAQEALQGLPDVVFDMSKSGAVLSWEFFHPDSEVPMLLQFVQDRDLWKFKFPETKAIHVGLGTLEGKMKAWDHYADSADYHRFNETLLEPNEELKHLVSTGQAILAEHQRIVRYAVPKTVKVIPFMGKKAGILNTGELVSEKGDAICRDEKLDVDLAILWFVDKDGNVILSMRSLGDETDVSAICKKLGGGGHFNAAGARVNLSDMPDILKGVWALP
jgi:oligoribonuclease NrnB/cAMP/cGMP phosphodiesterase (DHH superfamily)